MTTKKYIITDQISSTPLKGTNSRLEIYQVITTNGGKQKIGIIADGTGANFSRRINSQINFRPAYCVAGVLLDQKIRGY